MGLIFEFFLFLFLLGWMIEKISTMKISLLKQQIFVDLPAYLKRIYRISISRNKHEKVVWNKLIKLHKKKSWSYGIYEIANYVETVFELMPNIQVAYYYMIYQGSFHCRVKVLQEYRPELATDLFILASHFNNLLNNGVVVVNPESRYVEYHVKSSILLHLLFPGEIESQILRHYYTSKDVYWAFAKLVNDNEVPAMIIADLMRTKSKEEK